MSAELIVGARFERRARRSPVGSPLVPAGTPRGIDAPIRVKRTGATL